MEPIGPEGQEKGKSRGSCLATIILLVVIIAILAAIAIPNFLKFGARSVQSEAKSNLAAIHTAQIAYFGEEGSFGKTFKDIYWEAEGKNRYHYSLGSDHIKALLKPDPGETCGTGLFPDPSGVSKTGFTAHASGNMDNDPYIDGWQINDDRNLTNPCNDVNN